MNKDMFKFEPVIIGETESEPSLEYFVQQYYLKHVPYMDAMALSRKYIETFCKQYKESE